jgi:N-acetylglucosamine-6-phosphate deacetylase
VLGAVMSDAVTAVLIGDAHVDYAAARVLLRAKAPRVALITDGMPLAGTDDGESEGGRTHPRRRRQGRARVRHDHRRVITLDQAVRNAVAHMGVPLHDAVAMASANAARAMGVGDGTVAGGRIRRRLHRDGRCLRGETWWRASRCTSACGGVRRFCSIQLNARPGVLYDRLESLA